MILYKENIQALRDNSDVPPNTSEELIFIVAGYWEAGDGGGGTFRYNLGSKPQGSGWVDDNGLIIDANPGMLSNVWYQRLVDTPYISVKWFGARGDNYHDDRGAIISALTCNKNYLENGVSICSSGNTVFDIPATSTEVNDITRTRLYFPAGIYRISKTIGWINEIHTFSPYNIQGLEIIGENAIIAPYSPTPFIGDYAAHLAAGLSTKISGMTFRGFDKGLNILNAPQGSAIDFLMENCNFSEIASDALTINCPNSSILINNTTWRNCRHAIIVRSGNITVTGGWIKPNLLWFQNDYSIIVNSGFLRMKNMICSTPKNLPNNIYPNGYAYQYSWVVTNGGSFAAENVQFLKSEEGGKSIKTIVKNLKKGVRTKTSSTVPLIIILRECICHTSGPTICIEEIPNSIVFENNSGFISYEPIIKYSGNGGSAELQQKLDEMTGFFSIQMDNLPYIGQAHWQANSLYNKTHSTKDGLKFLPYIRVNNGLHSYGYLENRNSYATAQILRFFMGKVSHSVNVDHNAIFGGYSYEIFLCNVAKDQGQGLKMGNNFEYSRYRINTQIVGNQCLISSINNLTPTTNPVTASTPILDYNTPPTTNLIKVRTASYQPYGIFYEIRCLIPPMVQITNV